jgi:CHAD domain-containing protein
VPFAFKRKETAQESMSRLLEECVGKALKQGKRDTFEAIHCARKQVKIARAVLRLFKDELNRKSFKIWLKVLREAAKVLAPARDAYITSKTFNEVARSRTAAKTGSHSSCLQTLLKQECRDAMRQFEIEDRWKQVRRCLKIERISASKLRLKHDGWRAIAPGLKRSYRAAKKAGENVLFNPSAENLHEWRKRVKDVWYDISLLKPIWPEQMSTLAGEFERLSDIIGDHHDLHVLREIIVKKSVESDFESEAEKLIPIIDAKQTKGCAEALKLGCRLLHEKPSEFCSRLHSYWKRWKKKKPPVRVNTKRSYL